MKFSTHGILKKRNVLAVLTVLNQEQTVSRAHLARLTNLTPATVSSIVAKLESSDIVHMVGPAESPRGRRPVMVQFNPHAFYLAGADIGLSKAIAVVIDLHGNIIKRERVSFTEGMSRSATLRAVLELIGRTICEDTKIAAKVKGIGLSYPGLVDTERGIGLVAPNWPELNDISLVDILQKELKLFTTIENDGACMTLGQARFGVGRGAKHILGLILGRGIGSGIIINGEIYHGLSSTAGEFGHLTVAPNGPTCGCGNQGCVEVMASGAALALAATRLIKAGRKTTIFDRAEGDYKLISAKTVAEAALARDEVARDLMCQAADYIGIALADTINILNPELVIFSGGLSQSGEYFLERIKEIAKKRAYTFGALHPPQFAVARFGEDANCIGAGALVLDKILDADVQRTN
jgi:N-acetylglucosamine repressor